MLKELNKEIKLNEYLSKYGVVEYLKLVNCKSCNGEGVYTVADGEDDYRWEICENHNEFEK